LHTHHQLMLAVYR